MRVYSLFAALLSMSPTAFAEPAPEIPVPVGAGRVDITPAEPVHLINELGDDELAGVADRLFARALAIGEGDETIVLLAFDGIGVSSAITLPVRELLSHSRQLSPARIAVTATHTHWAPHLRGLLPTIWRGPLPAEQQERVDRYTDQLIDSLVEVANEALDRRKPALLSRTEGRLGFAANRRLEGKGKLTVDDSLMFTWNPDAPVDHSLPVLIARDAESPDRILALLTTYACHNVALTGREIAGFENRVHGDWGGLATKEIEERHPGTIALLTIGFGGDQRPTPCGGAAVAVAHADSLADEVDRLLENAGGWRAITAPSIEARLEKTTLPLEPLPDEPTLERYISQINSTSRSAIARAHTASMALETLDDGGTPANSVPFSVQSWKLGTGDEALRLLFLAGEVTVDYRALIGERFGGNLWLSAYANDIPCYIVSRRQLEAGGYEPGNSMYYYGYLTPFRPGVEERVLETVGRALAFPQ